MADGAARVLVVEDDADINETVRASLERAGYACTGAFSGSEARLLLLDGAAAEVPFDLVVCDLMLPGMTGEELIVLLRERGSRVPVIVISAKGAVESRVDVLKLGADDYLVKPFDLDELAVRVEVQLRHAAGAAGAACDVLAVGRWRLDAAARTLAVVPEDAAGSVGAREVPLTRTEFGIVELIARNPRRVLTKQDVYEEVWGEPYRTVEDATVTAHVSNIRAKLKPTGTDGYIKTVWGIGFKLEVPGA